MKAVIISIGDELVLGQTVDTNAAWLSERLARRGIATARHITVPDHRLSIVDALRKGLSEGELVLVTGGLGPTDDDLTRFALADVLGVKLELDAPALKAIEDFFAQRGRTMIERNKVQAMKPAGATMLANPAGTAPAIHAEVDGRQLYCVPGVPREMRVLWDKYILPRLPRDTGRTILTAKINTFGQGESDVAELLGELMQRDRNPAVGTTVSGGIVAVRVRSDFTDAGDAQRQLDQTIEQIERRLGTLVFGRDETTLAAAVGEMLTARRQTLATAESCTGGLIGKLLTDATGASAFYLGGMVTYAYALKEHLLGVPRHLLEGEGAVSAPVARAMAEGALERSGADWAISVTGIAGPTGGTEQKPVGTVWFGLAGNTIETVTARHVLPGDRDMVRVRAAHHALNLLRRQLLTG